MLKRGQMKSKYFTNPDSREFNYGKYTIKCGLFQVKNYPQTTCAMEQVSKAEKSDLLIKKNGVDDFTHSFEKLMHAFDAFIREYHFNTFNKKNMSPGKKDALNFENDDEYSLQLFWQLRNSCTHNGKAIDENIKKKYENIFKIGKDKGLTQIIDLPDCLIIGQTFIIGHEDYLKIKRCVFRYIGKYIPKEDLSILESRASQILENVGITEITIFPFDNFDAIAETKDVIAAGLEGSNIAKRYSMARLDTSRNVIFFLDTAEFFPVKLVPKGQKNYYEENDKEGNVQSNYYFPTKIETFPKTR